MLPTDSASIPREQLHHSSFSTFHLALYIFFFSFFSAPYFFSTSLPSRAWVLLLLEAITLQLHPIGFRIYS